MSVKRDVSVDHHGPADPYAMYGPIICAGCGQELDNDIDYDGERNVYTAPDGTTECEGPA